MSFFRRSRQQETGTDGDGEGFETENAPFSGRSAYRSTEDPDFEPGSIGGAGRERIRITRACDPCHRKKLKCDGNFPCDRCHQGNRECTNDRLEAKRGPKKSGNVKRSITTPRTSQSSILAGAFGAFKGEVNAARGTVFGALKEGFRDAFHGTQGFRGGEGAGDSSAASSTSLSPVHPLSANLSSSSVGESSTADEFDDYEFQPMDDIPEYATGFLGEYWQAQEVALFNGAEDANGSSTGTANLPLVVLSDYDAAGMQFGNIDINAPPPYLEYTEAFLPPMDNEMDDVPSTALAESSINGPESSRTLNDAPVPELPNWQNPAMQIRLITLYALNVHPILSLLHLPTLNLHALPPHLFLSMLCIATRFLPLSMSSESMGDQLLDLASDLLAPALFKGTDPPDLSHVQAVLHLILYTATSESTARRNMATRLVSVAVSVARTLKLNTPSPSSSGQRSEQSASVASWIRQQSCLRAWWALVQMERLVAIVEDTPFQITDDEAEAPGYPVSDQIWDGVAAKPEGVEEQPMASESNRVLNLYQQLFKLTKSKQSNDSSMLAQHAWSNPGQTLQMLSPATSNLLSISLLQWYYDDRKFASTNAPVTVLNKTAIYNLCHLVVNTPRRSKMDELVANAISVLNDDASSGSPLPIASARSAPSTGSASSVSSGSTDRDVTSWLSTPKFQVAVQHANNIVSAVEQYIAQNPNLLELINDLNTHLENGPNPAPSPLAAFAIYYAALVQLAVLRYAGVFMSQGQNSSSASSATSTSLPMPESSVLAIFDTVRQINVLCLGLKVMGFWWRDSKTRCTWVEIELGWWLQLNKQQLIDQPSEMMASEPQPVADMRLTTDSDGMLHTQPQMAPAELSGKKQLAELTLDTLMLSELTDFGDELSSKQDSSPVLPQPSALLM
ncbi:hypothetical protein M427DRAFT_68344 [Gonapodya prolifera JEL478]|uniref:Zn(2)-C6 fungal-type domain-containing protein n=1 Tax=Gonapodya prolifera (strain JEL478) TaxID=1344416 RepID=A0A139AL36_GONPJ|nr:hypothetical protein M427DRAFT_68344 [Gonapodya prolifera JEL478]|eukprot:KXS17509.1 hypothetical protein M427DRAFT_68344 [Gonapodya prolifera JEL478]